jgi:hypothetical protein
MTVKIPKSALGLSGDDYTINFSWPDNVHDEGAYTKFSGDILDFYISGDVAPGGRFKFSYVSTAENATGESAETDSVAADGEVTDAPTAEVTDSLTETDAPKGGCGSAVVTSILLPALVAVGTACVSRKRRKTEE